MDFSLTDEQRLLRDSVARFVADDCDFQTMRAQPAENGLRPEHWQTFAELGWLALMVPEEAGGLGGSLEDAALVFEELGRGLVDAPLLSTAVLAAYVVSQGTDFADRGAVLEGIAGGERRIALALEESSSRYDPSVVGSVVEPNGAGGYGLRGRKIMALDGASADSFLVSAQMPLADGSTGIAILLVPADAEGLDVRRYRLIDRRHAADLGLDGVHLAADCVVVPPEQGLAVLRETVNRASVLLAAEALGAMEAAMNMTADYIRMRRQFRRPLSDFQVLTHRVADMFVKVENVRSMILRGLSAMNGPVEERDAAVSATMITAIQAGEFVTANAVQLHGGAGMAEENVVGHYYKRLRAIAKSHGDLHFHMKRYMRALKN
ncbi:acyl-CoA dehydrogenase family protein [Mesorhizobium sp. A623]